MLKKPQVGGTPMMGQCSHHKGAHGEGHPADKALQVIKGIPSYLVDYVADNQETRTVS